VVESRIARPRASIAFNWSLRLGFRVLRLYANRRKVNMANESTNRQAIQKHVVHPASFNFDAGMTDFNPATPKATFSSESVCAMGGRFIDHASSLTRLEPR